MRKIKALACLAACAAVCAVGFSACGGNTSGNSSADSTDSHIYITGETYRNITLQKFFGEDGDTYTLQNDLYAGKAVIIYFWYTGCGPCEEDIPYLGELAQDENYADKVSVVVVHGGGSLRGTALGKLSSGAYYIESYITLNKGWDFYNDITWAIDTEDSQCFTELGGTNSYPVTAMLDSNGVIQYTSQMSFTKATLYEKVDSILALQ